MSRTTKLRNSSEFRVVYESGRRYDGRLMTAFLRRNDCDCHRLGITASRKVARGAVGRNRVKRLLRETFRLSGANLQETRGRYDWVLNAKRALLEVKLAAALEDFERILARLLSDERAAAGAERQSQ
ncbi:MAG: ribonuclease P protein component [Pyrinomonadaceae bacterium]|nr:ribonuclease P protein component [Pyrinomonadaceae bacterium]